MHNKPFLKPIRQFLLLSSALSFTTLLFAQGPAADNALEKDSTGELTRMQKEARFYRQEGFIYQSRGESEKAMAFYQKAVEMDPAYAVVYNDLGVIYEEKGYLQRARESFEKAILLDPYLLSAYTNLAMICEKERDLDQALIYWKKRADLGIPEEAWTEKAKQRVRDINLVLPGASLDESCRQDSGAVITSGLSLSRKLFLRAKLAYSKRNYAQAMKDALDAQYLDPQNPEIERFIEKVQKKALSR